MISQHLDKNLFNNKLIKRSIKKNKCYVNFVFWNTMKIQKYLVKYNLHKILINGNIFIINQGDHYFGNGNPYISKLLNSPT